MLVKVKTIKLDMCWLLLVITPQNSYVFTTYHDSKTLGESSLDSLDSLPGAKKGHVSPAPR